MADLNKVPLALVDDHPLQPRAGLDMDTVKSVRAAIADNGGTYPDHLAVTLRRKPDGRYEILSGHHRTAAAREVGLDNVWAFVRADMDDKQAAMFLAAANMQTSMSAFEHGRHALKLRDELGVDFKTYAESVGRTPTWIGNHVRAVMVLDSCGGSTGALGHLAPAVLSAAGRIPDRYNMTQVLWTFKDHKGPLVPVQKAYELLRDGATLGEALRGAKQVDRTPEQMSQYAGETHSRRDLAASAMQTHWWAADVAGLLRLLEVRQEELEKRKPDLGDPRSKRVFDDAVEARMRREMAENARVEANA